MTQPHGERSGETTLVVCWQLAGPPPIRVTVRPMLICLRVQRQRPDDGREASTFLFRFEQAEVLIGRSEAVEVRLPDPAVSLVHARILRRRGGKLVLVDDGSTNGTYVDGVRVEVGRARRLRAGSRIVAGPYVIDVLDPSSQASATATGRADTASYARQMVLEVMNKLAGDVPTIVVLEGPNAGAKLSLARDETIVGRADECDLALSDADCSRQHLRLARRDGVTYAVDLGSKNGVDLERADEAPQRIEGELALRADDVLHLGQTRLQLRDAVACELDALAEAHDAPLDDPLAGLLDDAPPAHPPRYEDEDEALVDDDHDGVDDGGDVAAASDARQQLAAPAAPASRVAAPAPAARSRDATLVIIVLVVAAVAGAIVYLLL
ncbi:MAG: FHA domain-containing protein [Myxococcales bacterium]|nr:FHA domain-containing protein [Myxococcales bacterium]